jgi:L-arabinose isomerase
MGRKLKPTYVEDEPLFNVDIWNNMGDVVRHFREVTAADVEDIRDQYEDEPWLDVVVEETR